MAQSRVITIRTKDKETGTAMEIEAGNKTIEKQIPIGFGMTRISIILDQKDQLSDVELVTEKL